jgi:hypothetical protein
VLLAVERLAVRADDGSVATPTRAAVAAVAAVCALVLLRSAFHLALMSLVIPLAALAARTRWRLVVAWALLVCVPAVGWYAKNQAQFGVFGASSWSGLGLYRVAVDGQSAERVAQLGPMYAELMPYDPPSRYARWGFTETSDVPVLAHDDYNNINVPGGPFTTVISGDCDENGDVNVPQGGSATCTVTNTLVTQTLTVNKVCVGTSDGVFDLEIDGSPAGSGDDAACGGTTGAVQVTAGAHDGSETVVSGGPFTTVISGDCDENGDVNVPQGGSATCTITNTLLTRTLTVHKV